MTNRILTILWLLLAATPVRAQEYNGPLCIVNGEMREGDALRRIPPREILDVERLPADERTIARYGEAAAHGVLLITLRYDTPALFPDSLPFGRYIASRVEWSRKEPAARVAFRYRVDTTGRVVLGECLEATDKRLKRRIVQAVGEAPRWQPATKEGRPVETEHVLSLQLPEGKFFWPERAVIMR